MQNKAINMQFSERLRELMVQRGFSSHNSASGVSPSALCKAIGCFTEMALRYLDGRSIPSPENIIKISEWLKVEPGFLLFGTQESRISSEDNDLIKVDKEFLEYALYKITPIIKKTENETDFLEFFVSILLDLSHMQIPIEQLKKVFDLTLKSSHFKKDVQTGNMGNGQRKIPSKIAS